MDNRKDRQFYWQIKDFMGTPHVPPSQPKKAPDVASVAKKIFEQNKPYRQSSFDANLTSKNTISQAINYIQQSDARYNPESPKHSKINASNPFRIINEGIFDDVAAQVNSAGSENEDSVIQQKIRSQAEQLGLNPDITLDELKGQIENDQPTAGQKLSGRQMNLRNLEGLMAMRAGKQQSRDQEQREAEIAAGGDRRMDAAEAARTRGMDQRQAASDAARTQQAQPQSKGASSTPGTDSTSDPVPPPAPTVVVDTSSTPLRDEEEDRWVAQRMKQNSSARQKNIDSLADNLAYLKSRGPTTDTAEGRARNAVAIQRTERALKRAQEDTGKSEDEERKQIRGQLEGNRAEKARWKDWDRASEAEKAAFRARYPKEAALKDKVSKTDADLRAAREAREKAGKGTPTSSTGTSTPTGSGSTTPGSTPVPSGNAAPSSGSAPATPTTSGTPVTTTAGTQQSPRDFNRAAMEPGKVYTMDKSGYVQSDVNAPENRPQTTGTPAPTTGTPAPSGQTPAGGSQKPAMTMDQIRQSAAQSASPYTGPSSLGSSSSTPAPAPTTQAGQRPAPMPTSEKPVPEPTSGRQPIYPGSMPDINNQLQTGSEVNNKANAIANKQKPAQSSMGALA